MESRVIFQQSPAIGKASLRKYSRIAVLVDQNTRSLCYPLIAKQLPAHSIIEVMAGEDHKNLVTSQVIWQHMTELGFDRYSLLIILGGGVLGDMGGFCAATFKRGIDFILMPTTLLSQVDSSIGGKLGVDFGPYKNHIGVFQQPVATYIAAAFLSTLPARELRSGFAEIVKHCIIGDKTMWKKVSQRGLDGQPWLALVRHSVAFKRKVTKSDPREKGLRKILNFGHTIGHALEGYFLNSENRLFHGEAIAIGMVMEAWIASSRKMISVQDRDHLTGYLMSVFGKVDVPKPENWLPLMKQDKKNKGNKMLMALPRKMGSAAWDIPVSERDIRSAWEFYCTR
jgi:3-dehydroquinate synthase